LHVSAKQTVNRELVMLSSLDAIWTVWNTIEDQYLNISQLHAQLDVT
jgi:hypothetical protein